MDFVLDYCYNPPRWLCLHRSLPMKTIRIFLNIILSALLLAGAYRLVMWMKANQQKPPQTQPEKIIPQVLAPPIQPRLDQNVEIVGYGSARPKVQLEITAQVSGIVVEKAPNYLSGKFVSRNQMLFRIEQTDYELAAERAEKSIELLGTQLQRLGQEEQNLQNSILIENERLDLAQSQVKKVTNLLQRGAASDNELDLARETLLARRAQLQTLLNQSALVQPQRTQLQAEISSARVELNQAQTNLDRCLVKSPVTGRVLACNVEVGEQVLAGAVCGQIYGTDVMEVPVSIAASDLSWIDQTRLTSSFDSSPTNPGDPIKAEVQWTGAGNTSPASWPGFVERIEAGLEAETRTSILVVHVHNPSPETLSLAPPSAPPMLEVNMFCKVIIMGKRLPEAYIIPRRAVLPSEQVYVVGDGHLQTQAIHVTRYTGEEAMILPGDGLTPGQRVVIDNIPKPVIGMTVRAVDTRAPQPDSSDSDPQTPQP